MKPTKIIGCVLGCISLVIFVSGIIPIGIAFGWSQHTHRGFFQTGERVEGVVVEVREHTSNNTRMYTPVVEFTDHLGQQQKVLSRLSSNRQWNSVGDRVQILYERDDSSIAMVDNYWEGNLATLMFLVIGIVHVFVAIVLALVAFFVYRHRPRNATLA